VVHHCDSSGFLSVISAFLALFHFAHVSSFSVLVQFFYVDSDFSTHDVRQKRNCPVLQKGVNRSRKTVILEAKMLVISKMEAGEKRKLKLYVIM
jgi:uncharacterized membrane protein